MNLLTRLYLLKFSNHTYYSRGVRDYLKVKVEQGQLNFKQIRYLYKNLYKNAKTVQQNIYPVTRAMINGLNINEIEQVANRLLDATDYSAFSVGVRGHKFNKLYDDLEFMFKKYVYWKRKGFSPISKKHNLYLYTDVLNKARAEMKYNDDEDIYEYVEKECKEIRKGIKTKKMMMSYKSKGYGNQFINHRHSCKKMYDQIKKQQDKEKIL